MGAAPARGHHQPERFQVPVGPGHSVEVDPQVGGERAHGVDFAENMIGVAQQTFPDLSFQVANGEALPFADDHFDCAVKQACHLSRASSISAKPSERLSICSWRKPKPKSSAPVVFVDP